MNKKATCIVLCLVFVCSLFGNSFDSQAKWERQDNPEPCVIMTFVDADDNISSCEMTLEKESVAESTDGKQTIYKTYSGYFTEIDEASGQNTRSTTTQTEQTIRWKGSVTITYTTDGTYATYSNASGFWTQLRGESYLKNRVVYYGCQLGVKHYDGTKKPSSNSFSYNTGFPRTKYGSGSTIGCNSSVDIYSSTDDHKIGTLFVNCSVTF